MLIACSLTGVDDRTDLESLDDLAAEFPFAEFAILYSHSRAGNERRYPQRNVIEALSRQAAGGGFRVALHLCGSAVADFVAGRGDVRALASGFGRVQLNFDAGKAPFSLPELEGAIRSFPGKVITQHNDANLRVSESIRASNHQVLFDASLGRGVEAVEWPRPLDGKTCGYAGGISPERIGRVLGELGPVLSSADAWIDMESRLRNADDLFDLGACRTVLEAVARSGLALS